MVLVFEKVSSLAWESITKLHFGKKKKERRNNDDDIIKGKAAAPAKSFYCYVWIAWKFSRFLKKQWFKQILESSFTLGLPEQPPSDSV